MSIQVAHGRRDVASVSPFDLGMREEIGNRAGLPLSRSTIQ